MSPDEPRPESDQDDWQPTTPPAGGIGRLEGLPPDLPVTVELDTLDGFAAAVLIDGGQLAMNRIEGVEVINTLPLFGGGGLPEGQFFSVVHGNAIAASALFTADAMLGHQALSMGAAHISQNYDNADQLNSVSLTDVYRTFNPNLPKDQTLAGQQVTQEGNQAGTGQVTTRPVAGQGGDTAANADDGAQPGPLPGAPGVPAGEGELRFGFDDDVEGNEWSTPGDNFNTGATEPRYYQPPSR